MQHGIFNVFRHVLLYVLLGMLVAAAAAADEPVSLFGDVIDVRVVNLEVVVTDGGARVAGLGPEDFVLTIDGKEVPIDYFTEVADGVAAAGGVAMVPELAAGEPVGTSYLLFIDEFFSVKPRRDLVLRNMIAQLAGLGPEDRMAVVAYDGRRLDLLSGWSGSARELEGVLLAAMDRPSGGMRQRSQERVFLDTATSDADAVPGPRPAAEPVSELSDGFTSNLPLGFSQFRGSVATTSGLSSEEEAQVGWLTERVVRITGAATAALRSFAKAPGRKVFLLTAGGWVDNPTEWLLRDTGRVETSRADDRNRIYGPLIETANRLSYTIYPVDVAGANEPGVDIPRATLRRLAAETGGTPMLAGDGLRALENTVADTRSYYWIGFIPQWKGDDSAHRVKVKPRRRGLDLRTRTGFSDLSRASEVTMMTESLLRLGGSTGAASFPVRVGEVAKAGSGQVEVTLEMLVPMNELTFLPHEGGYLAEAELRVAVMDAYGTAADVQVTPLEVSLAEPPHEGDMRRWESRIKIRKQKHDVVMTFYDVASGKLLSSRLEFDPDA